jgi:uncharacterized protein
MFLQSTQAGRIVFVRLDYGEDILLSLRAAVAQAGIRNGVILGGYGSVTSYHVHVVKTTNMPPGDTFFKGEAALDILTMHGMILDGRVHAHITFADDQKALGGHLEEGCHVLTFTVVTIAETAEADLAGWDRMGRLHEDQ